MRVGVFLSYCLAGVLLTNSVPHLVVAVTGKRNRTAFGRHSSPFVNLLWSGMNAASGYALFRLADRQQHGKSPDSTAWQLPYGVGCLALSVFGVFYAWFTSRSVGADESSTP